MLKITRAANGEVVFTLCGRMDAENVGEMKTLFGSEAKGRRIVLDLKDLTLVDREAVRFLDSCEIDSIKIRNCPAYIREWITRERAGDCNEVASKRFWMTTLKEMLWQQQRNGAT